jgi:hypothetical protein
MLSAGMTGAGLGALAGTSLRSAPSYLWGRYLNDARARTARRVLLMLCMASIIVAGLFDIGLIALARTSGLVLDPAALALLLVPISSCGLTGTGYLTAHRALHPD